MSDIEVRGPGDGGDGVRKIQGTDAQFLREVAHTADVGDPIESRHIVRLRQLADRLEAESHGSD